MSTPSTKFGLWHGIARETIPWFPTVNHDKCIGCELGFVTCGRGVNDVHDHKAWPERQSWTKHIAGPLPVITFRNSNKKRWRAWRDSNARPPA
jgi:Fe-S-cluster-containing hydrogenase component 2